MIGGLAVAALAVAAVYAVIRDDDHRHRRRVPRGGTGEDPDVDGARRAVDGPDPEVATDGAVAVAPRTPTAAPTTVAPTTGAPSTTAPTAAAPPAAAPTTTAPSRAPLSRRFDAVFRVEGRGIPVAYLRALAHAESGMRPDDPLGLINVVSVALADYDRRHRTHLRRADLRSPEISVRVAADILRTIIASYARHHPDVNELREDWSDPAFVGLLTFGWNAGFSERAGVGRVVRYLRRSAPGAPIHLDAVAAAAAAAGAASTLSNPRKLAYCKGVVASYFRERAAG